MRILPDYLYIVPHDEKIYTHSSGYKYKHTEVFSKKPSGNHPIEIPSGAIEKLFICELTKEFSVLLAIPFGHDINMDLGFTIPTDVNSLLTDLVENKIGRNLQLLRNYVPVITGHNLVHIYPETDARTVNAQPEIDKTDKIKPNELSVGSIYRAGETNLIYLGEYRNNGSKKYAFVNIYGRSPQECLNLARMDQLPRYQFEAYTSPKNLQFIRYVGEITEDIRNALPTRTRWDKAAKKYVAIPNEWINNLVSNEIIGIEENEDKSEDIKS